jgi:hypothetical protein
MAYRNRRNYIWYMRIRKHKKNKEKQGDKVMPKEASTGCPLRSQEIPPKYHRCT